MDRILCSAKSIGLPFHWISEGSALIWLLLKFRVIISIFLTDSLAFLKQKLSTFLVAHGPLLLASESYNKRCAGREWQLGASVTYIILYSYERSACPCRCCRCVHKSTGQFPWWPVKNPQATRFRTQSICLRSRSMTNHHRIKTLPFDESRV